MQLSQELVIWLNLKFSPTLSFNQSMKSDLCYKELPSYTERVHNFYYLILNSSSNIAWIKCTDSSEFILFRAELLPFMSMSSDSMSMPPHHPKYFLMSMLCLPNSSSVIWNVQIGQTAWKFSVHFPDCGGCGQALEKYYFLFIHFETPNNEDCLDVFHTREYWGQRLLHILSMIWMMKQGSYLFILSIKSWKKVLFSLWKIWSKFKEIYVIWKSNQEKFE